MVVARKHRNIVFVTKDKASWPAIWLAQECRKQGHSIFVIAEGLSAALWKKVGLSEHIVFQGVEDFRFVQFSVRARQLLRWLRADAVVVHEGDPVNLEERFAEAANRLRLPLVFTEDFWGGFRRIRGAVPDAVLTIDNYAMELAHKEFPRAFVVNVGNPAVPQYPVVAAEATEHAVKMLQRAHGKALLYIGGPFTSDLKLCLACLNHTEGALIFRPHPKALRERTVGGRTKGEVWSELVARYGPRVAYGSTWMERDINHLISLCDVICSPWSTSITTAACLGKPVASLWTSDVRRSLAKRGLLESPFTAQRLAVNITTPCDLGQLPAPPRSALRSLRPFSAVRAYRKGLRPLL